MSYTAKDLMKNLKTGKIKIDEAKDYTLYSYSYTTESQTPLFIVKGSDIQALIEKLREFASTETIDTLPTLDLEEGTEDYSLAIRLTYSPRKKTNLRLKYDLSDLKGGFFKTISVKDKYGRGATITTTSDGGLFYWSDRENTYKQIQGTAQFKITSEEQAKIELKARYEENLFRLDDYFYTENPHFNAFSKGIRIKAQDEEQAKRIALDQRAWANCCYLKLGTIQSMSKGLLTKEFWRCEPNSNQWQEVNQDNDDEEDFIND